MDKIQVTKDIQIERHQLEDFVQYKIDQMDTDDLKELAYARLLEYYEDNPQDLEVYFDDE